MNENPQREASTNPGFVRRTLTALGVTPSKALGQNFLIDANIARIIVEAARPEAEDKILEIGPGLGALTERLACAAEKVTAVEKDARLAKFLETRFAGNKNVFILAQDILDCDLGKLTEQGATKVVSNLPYSIGSAALMNLFLLEHPPRMAVVTLQSDVAARLTAAPGCKNYGMLGLWAQTVYHIEKVRAIGPKCFFPQPDVGSMVVRLTRRSRELLPAESKLLLYRLSKPAFSLRRKQLKNMFRKSEAGQGLTHEHLSEALREAGIPEDSRPETLGPEDWARLALAVNRRLKASAADG